MTSRAPFSNIALLVVGYIFLCVTGNIYAKEKDPDICSLVSAEQLSGIYRKELFPTEMRQGCFWSEEPGAMAYFQIIYHKKKKELRDHFNKELPSQIKIEEIKDLGDGGLMSINDDQLEVIVIQKDKLILKSMVSFLEIKSGSKQHQKLWDIYRLILKEL